MIPDGDLGSCPEAAHDPILCTFTFDNIPGAEKRVRPSPTTLMLPIVRVGVWV